jgi:hypothetical protein
LAHFAVELDAAERQVVAARRVCTDLDYSEEAETSSASDFVVDFLVNAPG